MLSTHPMLAVKLLTAKLTPPSIHDNGVQLALNRPSVHVYAPFMRVLLNAPKVILR